MSYQLLSITEPAVLTAPVDPNSPPYRLFSPTAVYGASFLGGPLGGFILLAVNYRRLGQKPEALLTLLGGAIFTGLVCMLSMLLPKEATLPIGIGLAFAMRQIAQSLQGRAIKEHADRGGQSASGWAAAGAGIAGLTIVCLSVGFLLGWGALIGPASLGQKAIIGTRDEIYYSGAASETDAQALGKALQADGFLTDRGVSVAVAKKSDGTTISFVVKDGTWDDPAHVRNFETMVREVGSSVGGLPIRLRLLNASLKVEKELIVQ